MNKIEPQTCNTRQEAEDRMKELIVIQEGVFCPDINAMCRKDCRDFETSIKEPNLTSGNKKDETWNLIKDFDNKKDEKNDNFVVTVCCKRSIKNKKIENKTQFGIGI